MSISTLADKCARQIPIDGINEGNEPTYFGGEIPIRLTSQEKRKKEEERLQREEERLRKGWEYLNSRQEETKKLTKSPEVVDDEIEIVHTKPVGRADDPLKHMMTLLKERKVTYSPF